MSEDPCASAVKMKGCSAINLHSAPPSRVKTQRQPTPPQFRKAVGYVLLGAVILGAILFVTSHTCMLWGGAGEGLVWWKTTIIYQSYPRSFQDSNGDGNGDLKGFRSRIGHLEEIGVRAVWLNPIYPSPRKDSGYDIANYTSVDPLYGTMDDLRAILKDLHDKGIRLLMDLVPNHTSNEHPWFIASRSSLTNPKRNWYIWADPNAYGGPPNNWISHFGGSAWTFDNTTNQYYLHQFSEFQPDLNYHNPEVIAAMEGVIAFWLEFGVDGFRMDAIKFLLEDPQLHNETRNPSFTGNCTTNISDPSCWDSQIHNLTTNYPGIHDIYRDFRKVLDSFSAKTSRERFMVGEIYDTTETVMSYYGRNNDEFDFPFNFFLLTNRNWTGVGVSEVVGTWLANLPEGAWPNWVLGNHNNDRISSITGVYLARAMNVLLLTLPGTPTTYYGEEILMTDVYVPPPKRHDMFGNADKEKTPMQWNTSTNAGFTSGTPWLPLPDNFTTYNVEVEDAGKTSMLNLYKKLSELRSTNAAFRYTGYELVDNTSAIYAYRRYDESSVDQFLVIVNFVPYSIKAQLKYVPLVGTEVVLSSFLNRTGDIDLKAPIELAGGEALVIRGSGV